MTFDQNWQIHEKVRWQVVILANETNIEEREREREREPKTV